jgi:hypothetical protein
MKDLRFQTEIELWLEFCQVCECSKTLHNHVHIKDHKFVKRKLPHKWALVKAEHVLEECTVEDVIAIAFALEEVADSLKPNK